MLEPFHFAFVQRGLVEILLLSVAAGLLGTWIVLRGLTFYSHAVATAAFPGLVIADGLALSAPLCAFVAAIAFAFGVERLARDHDSGHDSLTALVLVGALALGVILASDVFHTAASVESLLFGSLLLIGPTDIVLAAMAAVAVLVASYVLGRRWLATGFDPQTARALGARSALSDAALLGLIALTVIATLSAVGALLATALVVVPAATVRLLTRNLRRWQLGSIVLAAVEGCIGLWLSVEMNVPPGAAIALVGGGVFALAALAAGVDSARRGRSFAAVATAGAALLFLTGCGSARSTSGISVVATTTQIADWVRQVGGANASVHQILQPNTDPHEYEPRPKDVERTAGAKIVFESGSGLDHWMSKVIAESGAAPAVVVLGDVAPVKLRGEASGSETSRSDPHWWHDPRNAEAAVTAIRNALAQADPAHKVGYDRRAAAYVAKLQALDSGIARCIARVPVTQRRLVTDHDAFDYFAARYGIRVIGAVIPSQTTQAQPSAGDLARLIAFIRREHVRAVFPESSLNSRLAKTIASETGARSDLTLYGDTLGPSGSTGATYLTMEEANANAVVRGFTGGASGCRFRGTH
jgi:ABC-type Zn uptake system ZnuABC Zn-binding protein ZnuA/ABC-type Mn2+/Zn2+ transport system permease subunit